MRPPSKSPSAGFQQKSEPYPFLCNVRLFIYFLVIYISWSPQLYDRKWEAQYHLWSESMIITSNWGQKVTTGTDAILQRFHKNLFHIYGLHKPGKKILETIHFFFDNSLLKNSLWKYSWFTMSVTFCYKAKWFSYIYYFTYSFPLWFITGYWI